MPCVYTRAHVNLVSANVADNHVRVADAFSQSSIFSSLVIFETRPNTYSRASTTDISVLFHTCLSLYVRETHCKTNIIHSEIKLKNTCKTYFGVSFPLEEFYTKLCISNLS